MDGINRDSDFIFEVRNLTTEFWNELGRIVNEAETKNVCWIGYHPWMPYIYSALISIGAERIEIADNDVFIQGAVIYPFEDWSVRDDSRGIEIISLEEVKKDNTIYLMANSHYDDIVNQLSSMGVDCNIIFNLHKFTLEYILYWEEERERVKENKKLSLKEVQKYEFEILEYFKEFCEKHNLRYYLAGGTLIGAVRHKGFIPWDDDVDVYMPYEDYFTFRKIFQAEQYMYIDCSVDNQYVQPFGRILRKGAYTYEPGYELLCGRTNLFIDIFPLAGYPSNEDDIEKRFEELRELNQKWYWSRMTKGSLLEQKTMDFEMFEKEWSKIPFDESEFIGTVMPGMLLKKQRVNRREMFDETAKVWFEGEQFDAPIEYDQHLRGRFGNNYMKLPLLKDRDFHCWYRMSFE